MMATRALLVTFLVVSPFCGGVGLSASLHEYYGFIIFLLLHMYFNNNCGDVFVYTFFFALCFLVQKFIYRFFYCHLFDFSLLFYVFFLFILYLKCSMALLSAPFLLLYFLYL